MSEALVLTNVYVRSLPMDWDKNMVDQLFMKYGRIVSSKVLYNPVTTASRGIAFVRFDNHESAASAIEALNGYIPDSSIKPLVVQFAKGSNQVQPSPSNYGATRSSGSSSRYSPYGSAPSSGGSGGSGGSGVPVGKDPCNLYICDVPPTTTLEVFRPLFEQYGQVMSCKILTDPSTGLARGIGFCRYADSTAASAAVQGLNGHMMQGSSKPITVTYARNTAHRSGETSSSAPTPAPSSYAMPSYGQSAYGATDPNMAYAYAQQPYYGQQQYAAAQYGYAPQGYPPQPSPYGYAPPMPQYPSYPGYDQSAYPTEFKAADPSTQYSTPAPQTTQAQAPTPPGTSS